MQLVYLFDNCATSKILDFMIEHKDVYSKTEIAQETGLSLATVIKTLRKLSDIHAVIFDKRQGNCQMYRVNNESAIVDLFKGLKNV